MQTGYDPGKAICSCLPGVWLLFGQPVQVVLQGRLKWLVSVVVVEPGCVAAVPVAVAVVCIERVFYPQLWCRFFVAAVFYRRQREGLLLSVCRLVV